MEWLWRFVLTAAVQTQKLLCCAVLCVSVLSCALALCYFSPHPSCATNPCLVPVHMVTLTCKGRAIPHHRCDLSSLLLTAGLLLLGIALTAARLCCRECWQCHLLPQLIL